MDKFRNEVNKSLLLVPEKGKIIFALLTCEKLYSNYVFFSKATNWGNSATLLMGTSLVYQYLIHDLYNLEAIKQAIIDVDNVTPDTEDFPGILTSFALDACTSVHSTLKFLVDRNVEHLIDVATYARDTVYMFLQETLSANLVSSDIEYQIENDKLLIAEKTRQFSLIEILQKSDLSLITNSFISGLKNNDPIIDLSLLSLK